MPDLSRSHLYCKVRCPSFRLSPPPQLRLGIKIFPTKHFFPNLPGMSDKQIARRSKKRTLERWQDRLRGSAQPGRLHLFSRDRSRQPSREPSPVPSRGRADNTSVTDGASSSTLGIRPNVDDTPLVAGVNAIIPAIKLNDRLDEKSDNDQNAELGAATDGSQDQENQGIGLKPNTDAADSAQEDNMWKIAEAELRQDLKMNELLDAYYDILKSKLNDFDSSNTSERQKQISAFIESESKNFQDASKLGPFASVLKKGAGCILKAEKVISAAAQPCLPASVACAGVMLVLSVSPLLRLSTPGADAQIALYSSRQPAGCSLRRPE